MSTTVSHRIPTAQAHAIADLTGYEDQETLRWQQACVQAANTLTALPNGRYVHVRMERMRQGLELAQRGAVTLPEDGEQLSAVVRSGNNLYQIDTRLLTCTCGDYQKHLAACKHLLAVEVHIGALGLSGLAAEPLNPPTPEPAITTSVPAPAPLTRIDNPAGCNLKFRIGPNELWFTLHDRSDEALLARLQTTLPLLQDIVEACEQRYAQHQQEAERTRKQAEEEHQARSRADEVTAAAEAARKAQAAASTNGQHTTPEAQAQLIAAQHDHDPSWCHKHQVNMVWHDANARGPGWFSHQFGNGYCKGK
jgi:SWIM zinc finger